MVQPQTKELSMRGDVERTEDLFSYVVSPPMCAPRR